MTQEPTPSQSGDGSDSVTTLRSLRCDVRTGGWKVQTTRPHERVMLFEVGLSDLHEFFFAAVRDKSVSITSFDPSDETHLEPQTFVFAKPYGWDTGIDGDEALLQVWQAVGVQR